MHNVLCMLKCIAGTINDFSLFLNLEVKVLIVFDLLKTHTPISALPLFPINTVSDFVEFSIMKMD